MTAIVCEFMDPKLFSQWGAHREDSCVTVSEVQITTSGNRIVPSLWPPFPTFLTLLILFFFFFLKIFSSLDPVNEHSQKEHGDEF